MKRHEPSSRPAGQPSVQDYTDLAPSYDVERYVSEEHAAHEERRRRVLSSLLPRGVTLAADIACGTGRGLPVLRTVADTVVGVDGTLAMLSKAREKVGDRTPLTQANAVALPFKDGAFDLITCLNFLHLFPRSDEKTAFVTEMGRVLKPGGVLIAEFDNALQGVVLGPVRKYFGPDIGYDWPSTIHKAFRKDIFVATEVSGANLPFVWRVPFLRILNDYTTSFPLNYLATRIFVRAVRR